MKTANILSFSYGQWNSLLKMIIHNFSPAWIKLCELWDSVWDCVLVPQPPTKYPSGPSARDNQKCPLGGCTALVRTVRHPSKGLRLKVWKLFWPSHLGEGARIWTEGFSFPFVALCAAWESLSSWHWVGSPTGNWGQEPHAGPGLRVPASLNMTCDENWGMSHLWVGRRGSQGSWPFPSCLSSLVGIEHRSGAWQALSSEESYSYRDGFGVRWARLPSCGATTGLFLWAPEGVGWCSLTGGPLADCGLHVVLFGQQSISMCVHVCISNLN